MRSVSICIYGRVQGVSFRYYTLQQARLHNLRGYVQNRPDGSVHIEAEGTEEKVESFLRWCHDGPPWAIVENIQISDLEPRNFNGFTIK